MTCPLTAQQATVEQQAAKKVTKTKETSSVYSSIFVDKKASERETYACRSVGARYI